MTLQIPPLYHWCRTRHRHKVKHRGLLPRTPTVVPHKPASMLKVRGHQIEEAEEWKERKAVCLGTSPATAWALSGWHNCFEGDIWDCWEVTLSKDDEVHFLPEQGGILDEVRVMNRIPKSRVWYIGTRQVKEGQRWHA